MWNPFRPQQPKCDFCGLRVIGYTPVPAPFWHFNLVCCLSCKEDIIDKPAREIDALLAECSVKNTRDSNV